MSFSNPFHHSPTAKQTHYHMRHSMSAHNPIPASDFWFSHLTRDQQEYIIEYYTSRYPAMLHISMIQAAYIEQCYAGWQNHKDWPAYVPKII